MNLNKQAAALAVLAIQGKNNMLGERIEIDPSIFRRYDIRGVVGKELTETIVYAIGKAFASFVLEKGENQLAVGRDGRLSGDALSRALCEGILSTGCQVVDVGQVPTPLLYYAAFQLHSRSGVMLTGSHNPSDYNGVKMLLQGRPLTEDEIKDLYHRIKQQAFAHGQGEYHAVTSLIGAYEQAVLENIKLARPLKVVVDAGNGVAGLVAPALFKALGCDVHPLFCEIDGTFPNHHPDPCEPENLTSLIEAVRATKADIGLAFDGDGDRLGVVTSKGKIIWADRLLMLFASSVLAVKPNAKIIYDVKCSHHLANVIRAKGGEPIMWKTGHSLIKAKLAETHASLAGEMSGHLIFTDRWFPFDDGCYAGARLLEILSQQDLDSDTLFATFPESVSTPELKVHINEEEKFTVMQQFIEKANFSTAEDILNIDGLRVNFADGWGLLRPSNTTPYLILRFEAINETVLKQIQTLFREWMLSVRPELTLPF